MQEKGRCDECDEAQAIYDETLERLLAEGVETKTAKQRASKAANRLRGRPRFLFVVTPVRVGGKLVENEDDQAPAVWWASKTTGERIVEMLCDEDVVDDISDALGSGGMDVKVRYDPDADPSSMYSVSLLPANKAKSLPAEWQEKAQALDLFVEDRYEPTWNRGNGPAKTEVADTAEADGKADEPDTSTASEKDRIKADALARLKADGIDDQYDVEVFKNGGLGLQPCYYAVGSDKGSWDYPSKPDAPARSAPPSGGDDVDAEVDRRFTKGGKKTRTVIDDGGVDDAE